MQKKEITLLAVEGRENLAPNSWGGGVDTRMLALLSFNCCVMLMPPVSSTVYSPDPGTLADALTMWGWWSKAP